MEKHNFNVATIAGKPYCINCGLLMLRNPLTDWCVRKGCDYREASGYAAALQNLPAKHRGE